MAKVAHLQNVKHTLWSSLMAMKAALLYRFNPLHTVPVQVAAVLVALEALVTFLTGCCLQRCSPKCFLDFKKVANALVAPEHSPGRPSKLLVAAREVLVNANSALRQARLSSLLSNKIAARSN